MAALNEKQIVAGVLLFAFLVLIMLSVQFMQDSSGNVLIKEAFTSSGPTRASDCKCLPGYIPSNSGRADVKLGMFNSGSLLLYTDTTYTTYDYYGISIIENINILLRCMGLNRSYEHYNTFVEDLMNGSIPNCIYFNDQDSIKKELPNFNNMKSLKTLNPNTVCSAIQALPSTNKKGYSCLSLGDGSTKPCY